LYLLTLLQNNPNFLILDEPTNDLDLITIGVLEDFLMNFQGCLIVVSHDRFFMDRITDHLFIFEGDGIVKDFWGTYSEYKEEKEKNEERDKKSKTDNGKRETIKDEGTVKKLSYMEKRELDQLIKDIQILEKKRDEITRIFDRKDVPYDDIRLLSEELGMILRQLEQKEYRRFELSARE
jgi:ATP-binding cassette subfamily F protein uup